MTDEQLKTLLQAAGWRHFYTFESGEEEWTGPSDSDTPNMDAIRALVNAACEAEREAILDAVEDDMSIERAENLARLWAGGKMIGGDAHAASLTLLREVDRLRGPNVANEPQAPVPR